MVIGTVFYYRRGSFTMKGMNTLTADREISRNDRRIERNFAS